MRVDVWSDVVCPWCYIGKRNLEAALGQFDHGAEVIVRYRSFELDPSAEPWSPGKTATAHLSAKFGVPPERVAVMQQGVRSAAAAAGLDYHLDECRPGNSLLAHRLIHLAETAGLQAEMKERLMRAYFTEALAIDDVDVLQRLAVEVGLDGEAVTALFEGDRFIDAVRADEAEATELGIRGVPFFVVDDRYGISGAQPADVLLGALRLAWDGELAMSAD